MAEQMSGMLVEERLVVGTGAKHGQGRKQGFGAIGVIAAALALVLIGSVALHYRSASHPATPVIAHAVTSQQTRFLENNTTNLPNAVAAESRPAISTGEQRLLAVNTSWLPNVANAAVPMTSGEQRFLEVNTITLPIAGAASVASPVITQEQQRFWEANTMLPEGPLSPYMEDLTPPPGQPR
jgi:hypothetical protein